LAIFFGFQITLLHRAEKTMEDKGSSYNGNPTTSSLFTNKELEVCEILLQLPSVILQSKKFSRYTFKVTWGCTKPRSTLPSVPACIDKTSRTESESESETPVSYCLPHKKPKNLKRKRDDFLFDIINQFTKRIESFKKEIANVKTQNNEKLKELRKQEEDLMSSCMAPLLGIPDLNVPLDLNVDSTTLDEDCVIVKSAPAFDLNETPLDDDDCVIVEPALQVFDHLDVAKKLFEC